MKRLLGLSTLLLLSCSAPDTASGPHPFEAGRWVDLTHAYDERTVYWPTGKPFEHVQTAWGETEAGYFYSSYDFATSEHSGTHIDAPIHFSSGRRTVDRIPLSELVGPAAVVDVTGQAAEDPDYLVTRADIEAAELADGAIPAGAIVLIRTGWSSRWPDRQAYLGDDAPGRADNLHFPGLDPAAAEYLAALRIGAVGIDTASIDHGPSADFPAHRILAARDIPALENLTNLERLPARGAWVIAMPMKIAGGSGAPCRVAALVEPADR